MNINELLINVGVISDKGDALITTIHDPKFYDMRIANACFAHTMTIEVLHIIFSTKN